MAFRVAIVGDSLMWGQGLARRHTFAYLAASRIAAHAGDTAEIIPGRSHFDPLRGESRSGAKIQAIPEISRPVHVPGEPGAVGSRPGEHTEFIATYPTLFHTDAERSNFLQGTDETPATRLYGEVPAAFPEISEAVHHLAGANPPAQLVILDGGVNDVNLQDILNPDGPAITEIDARIENVFGRELRDLLRAVRSSFPSAVIMVSGYFSPLSDQSDRSRIRILLEYMSGELALLIAANRFVESIWVVSDLVNALPLGFTDVDALAEIVVRRAVTAAAHAHFWTRRTIAALPPEILGPGIVYVYPAFGPENAAFSGKQPFVWEGYRPPNQGRHSVADEMVQIRHDNIPRIDLVDTFNAILTLIGLLSRGEPGTGSGSEASQQVFEDAVLAGIKQFLPRVLAEADLPVGLRAAAQQVLDGTGSLLQLLQLEGEIALESKRIFVATIASFLHPNELGARRYADRIVAAFIQHERFSVRSAVLPVAGSGKQTVSVGQFLRAHGLDPARGLRPLAPLAPVQSVAVELRGIHWLIPPSQLALSLVSVKLTLGASLSFQVLVPVGPTSLFRAFDVLDVPFTNVTEVSLEAGLFGVDEVAVFINGHDFFSARSDDGHQTATGVTFDLAL